MKRLYPLLLLILAIGLAACAGPDVPQSTPAPMPSVGEEASAPAGESTAPAPELLIGGVELSGLSLEQAVTALNGAASAYELELTVNEKTLLLTADELGLRLDEDALAAYLNAAAVGAEAPQALFTYDAAALTELLGQRLDTQPTDASIVYDGTQKRFVVTGGVEGKQHDLTRAAAGAGEAIALLSPTARVEAEVLLLPPELSADSEPVRAALDKANSYLGVSLTYTYTPAGGSTASERLSAETLASFVTVSREMEVGISRSAVEDYAAQMAERHRGADYEDEFKTTGGTTISTLVTYQGQRVNTEALAEDIYQSLTGLRSGTRTAPYKAKSDKPYGGSYVEIDLSAQKLWLYIDGERLLTTKLVSGSVAERCCTPTGVYSIYAKQTDRYLTGEDYSSFVHYWMPFLGGYGLHDASWRSSFGGEIYYYDGSHGCVNLPSSAAKKLYNNVSVGTKVILYGGKRSVPNLEQKLTATTGYEVTADAAPFSLDVKVKYPGTRLSYASSDTRVLRVSSEGVVTIIGEGTAVITVDAAPFSFYTSAELKITVKVGPAIGTEPTNPPTEPTDPPTEPTNPPTEPTDPPTEPTDPPTEPTTPPTEPTTPPTEPTDPPTEPSEPAESEPAA